MLQDSELKNNAIKNFGCRLGFLAAHIGATLGQGCAERIW